MSGDSASPARHFTRPGRLHSEGQRKPRECRAESGRRGECGTYRWSEATSAAYSTSTERCRPSCAAAASPRLSDKALLQSPTPTPPHHRPTRGAEPDCASPSSAAATPSSHQARVVPTRTFVVTANERSDRLVFSFRNVLEPLHEIPLQRQNLRQVSHESQLCLLEREARPRVSSPEHVPGEMDSGAGPGLASALGPVNVPCHVMPHQAPQTREVAVCHSSEPAVWMPNVLHTRDSPWPPGTDASCVFAKHS